VDTPAHITRLLERCLRKDPKKRLRDLGDARLMIEEPDAGGADQKPLTQLTVLLNFFDELRRRLQCGTDTL